VARRIVLLLIVFGVAGALYWIDRPPAIKTPGNAQGPQFSVTDLNGNVVSSQSLRGKIVLVDFWATWCVPCESEIPHLVEWQKQHAADGLQVVGISMDDTSAPVKAYVAKHGMPYPVAMADDRTIAAFGGVLGLPANILIARDGHVIAKHVGVTDINQLQKEVEQALAAK
jgi:cytochrome c biogenesis protein CcmG, thiol:disulfide interchange protein DsbE